jgi:hypothetical protein
VFASDWRGAVVRLGRGMGYGLGVLLLAALLSVAIAVLTAP